MKNKKMWRAYLICLLLLSVVFIGLYHPFISGNRLFAYDDIGGDSIHQYLPMSFYELGLLEKSADGTYSLQYGLGSYRGGVLAKYLFPLQLPMLIFGADNLHIAILVRMYLCYAVMCLFGLLFFNRIFKNEHISSVCALLWTFTSYAVLWGQHYSFLIYLSVFTMALYGFQLYLEEDRHWYWVIPLMAMLIGSGYYITYMSCFFLLPYGVLYLAYHRKKFLYILKRIGIFIPVMIFAACMAGVYILPSILALFKSTRMQTNVSTGFGWIPKLHTPLIIFTFLTRLININLLGVGNNFYSTINYYECAILAVSILFVFAFLYMLQTKYWKRVLVITGICAIALCSPYTSQLIQFAPFSQRWTYILSFAQVILIGFAASHIFANRTEASAKRRYLITAIAADVIILGFLAFLYLVRVKWGVPFNAEALVTVAIILLVYHIAFFFLWKNKFGYSAVLVAVAIELILANYATVNQRVLPTVDQWYTAYANDGTAQVVEWLQEQDSSLYRINKTYRSLSNNDSLMQDYNGMGIYQSTLSTHLINVARSYGYTGPSTQINFLNNTVTENAMLGVKYVIAYSGTEMDPMYYTQIYDDGNFCVFQNNYYLGFGYLYQGQMQASDFYGLPPEEGAKLLSQYYFVTGSDDVPSIHGDQQLQIDDSQLQPNLAVLQDNCITDLTQDGNTFRGTIRNPYEDGAMLCLPLIYSDDWVATVDGEAVPVENINAGLVGIPLSSGEHTIQITYVSNIHMFGIICSLVSVAAYILFLFGKSRFKKSSESK